MHIHSDIPKATKKYCIFHGCFEYLPHFCWNVHNFYLWLLSFVPSQSARMILFPFPLFLMVAGNCFLFWFLFVWFVYFLCVLLNFFWNFDGEKCPWKMFFGKKIKPHRPHAHKRSLAVKDETHFGFMAMAITFVCLVTARKKHRAQYTNRKKHHIGFCLISPA